MKRTSTLSHTARLRRVALAPVAGLAMLAGCGAGDGLTAPVDTLVELEATWQCDVTRFSFESADAIDTKREQIRSRFGVDEADHRRFVDLVESDAGLRDQVADRLDELCPAEAGTS